MKHYRLRTHGVTLLTIALGASVFVVSGCVDRTSASRDLYVAYQQGRHSGLNLLVITADDLGADEVVLSGDVTATLTPNLERVAREAFRFEKAFVNSSICHPSRNVWMTGLYPSRFGGAGFGALDPEVPTVVEALKRAGYVTARIGKETHTLPERPWAWDLSVESLELSSGRDGALYAQALGQVVDLSRKRQAPFLAFVNLDDPHRPFPGSLQESERQTWDASFAPPQPPLQSEIAAAAPVPPYLPDLPDIRVEWAEYLNAVERMDLNVGRVLAELRRRDLVDSTIVMFLSDNGPAFPFAKTNLWDASIRVPWLIRGPGIPIGRDRSHLVSGIDLAPTLLDLAGVPPLPGADGESVVPLVAGHVDVSRDLVFAEVQSVFDGREFPMRTVREGDMAYIFNAWAGSAEFEGTDPQAGLTWRAMLNSDDPRVASRVSLFRHRVREELYDYASDPFGLVNLAEDPRYSSVLDELRQQMLHLMVRNEDSALDDLLGVFPRRTNATPDTN